LHLLPVNPTPTTYARFGRFGSPYAARDLTAIDSALVVFDRRSTGVDQFRELTYETHRRGGRVFLDIVINHTGWGSVLQERHPEWFLRQPEGTFVSPGAWGVTWEDLVELKHDNVGLWDELAAMFVTWCRRGVDGFRCDAGYKVPVPAWQYIVARVQQDFPETIFLLEGLGGAWEATEALLTEGGMQWAYSELFQNYSGAEVGGYLEHSHKQSARVGILVHYSETHDNERLAARSRTWSLLRNRLSALASVSGGFGFTCGVEWLASEKIQVHSSTGLAWDNPNNLVPGLAKLNQLLADHPCFFDGATLSRLSPATSPVFALLRESAEGKDRVLVLVNTDPAQKQSLELDPSVAGSSTPALHNAAAREVPLAAWQEMLGQTPPEIETQKNGKLVLQLAPGAACCLAPATAPVGLHGDAYRRARAQAAWGLTALTELSPAENIGEFDWQAVAAEVDRGPAQFLARISTRSGSARPGETSSVSSAVAGTPALDARPQTPFPRVVLWTPPDRRRITLVPTDHWLLLLDDVPFRASLSLNGSPPVKNVESIAVQTGHIACFPPRQTGADCILSLERYAAADQHLEAAVRFLSPDPGFTQTAPRNTDLVLLTNERGGMARLCVDLGRVRSKYDCVLGANLHPTLPVDRHVLAKRIRVWVNADGFIAPLDYQRLASFESGPPALWRFVAQAGDGRCVNIELRAQMLDGQNATVFQFHRPLVAEISPSGAEASRREAPELSLLKPLPADADVRLTVRIDIEDRNFHWETKRNGGADYHFSTHTHPLPATTGDGRCGFAFTPAADRQLRVFADSGQYHPQPEWSENLPHPVEQSRGQPGSGDAFSPGWFEIPLTEGSTATLSVTAEPVAKEGRLAPAGGSAALSTAADSGFAAQLKQAIRAFVVQRGEGKTVIAGYPWFLDWGRDTFICARGLLAAGMVEEVKQILLTFARFEKNGTLPNTIFGEDASNRDTSDAPLWFGLVAEELGAKLNPSGPSSPISSIATVLESIARNYVGGTPNGIRMDPDSALICSPSHFSWMDTNYPACTPREGYPVEIQALWLRLLQQLARIAAPAERPRWERLGTQAQSSLERLFWREDLGYYADVLLARSGQPAAAATVDDALRSNCLFLVSLGLVTGPRAQRCVEAARRYLVVPGALRSLAPLPVTVPLPNRGNDGRLLNDPKQPYWGHYEGDEDTRRKPAYHNGTAWTWTFPVFCEALARAYDFNPAAVAAARAYLGSMARLMSEGCLGQIPEIVDGEAPHTARGCDAQAWAATEALRVWQLLSRNGANEFQM
jgi:predicted glycogen debranching enzyme